MTQEELVVLFRKSWQELDPSVQAREIMRLNRLLKGMPVLIVEPIDEPDRQYSFESVEHFVMWVQNNGHDNASSSNVYKCLNNQRLTAYGYKFKYKKEK